MANHLRVASVFPSEQTTNRRCDQANYQLSCQSVITNTPNPNFRRVEILVRDAFTPEAGNHLARVVVFLSSAP
ncbi:MAG: hypothetical protein HC848_04005 [Limnobacter sp.]|nr:hypothetical protein [Limnobacter sp.]